VFYAFCSYSPIIDPERPSSTYAKETLIKSGGFLCDLRVLRGLRLPSHAESEFLPMISDVGYDDASSKEPVRKGPPGL
jgi:hypothetical protein